MQTGTFDRFHFKFLTSLILRRECIAFGNEEDFLIIHLMDCVSYSTASLRLMFIEKDFEEICSLKGDVLATLKNFPNDDSSNNDFNIWKM